VLHPPMEIVAVATRARVMTRIRPHAWLCVASLSLGGCAHLGATAHHSYVTADERRGAIARAQVWTPTDVASQNLRIGPDGPGAFPPNATIHCAYQQTAMGGATPKFTCVIPPDDALKIKYGVQNGEVYAEVAAARLFWALGFGAERMYPVRVVCQGCPPSILHDTDIASVQRKTAGTDLETAHRTGWAWTELDQVDPAAGGAPRAQRDALKLLAALIQHTDSKPEQQRLVCVPPPHDPDSDPTAGAPRGRDEDRPAVKTPDTSVRTRLAQQHTGTNGQAACATPVMLVHDLGKTFGHANVWNRSTVASVNLQAWSRAPVWQDPERCIAYLPRSHTGTLDQPRISEEGRQFLATLLLQLTDTQLHDLFDVARFPQRWDPVTHPEHAATVEQWVTVFKAKRAAVVQQRCGGG
jgi:hypothetical protein